MEVDKGSKIYLIGVRDSANSHALGNVFVFYGRGLKWLGKFVGGTC